MSGIPNSTSGYGSFANYVESSSGNEASQLLAEAGNHAAVDTDKTAGITDKFREIMRGEPRRPQAWNQKQKLSDRFTTWISSGCRRISSLIGVIGNGIYDAFNFNSRSNSNKRPEPSLSERREIEHPSEKQNLKTRKVKVWKINGEKVGTNRLGQDIWQSRNGSLYANLFSGPGYSADMKPMLTKWHGVLEN